MTATPPQTTATVITNSSTMQKTERPAQPVAFPAYPDEPPPAYPEAAGYVPPQVEPTYPPPGAAYPPQGGYHRFQ